MAHVRSEKIKSLISQLFPEERQPEGPRRWSSEARRRRTAHRDAILESLETSRLLSSTRQLPHSTASSSNQDLQPSPVRSRNYYLQPSPVSSRNQHLQPSTVSSRDQHLQPSTVSSIDQDLQPSPVSSSNQDLQPSPVSSSNQDLQPSPVSSRNQDLQPSPVSSRNQDLQPSPVSSSNQDLQPSPVSSSNQDLQPSPISSTQDPEHSEDPAASAISRDEVVAAQDNEEQASSPCVEDFPGPQLPRPDSGRDQTDGEDMLGPQLPCTDSCREQAYGEDFPGLQLPCPDSGREQTDGEDMLGPQLPCPDFIPANLMIKNLDTGEEIPMIQAVEELPSGVYPLTRHIMVRTQEYGSYDADQSDDEDHDDDDDDRERTPVTDTDTEDSERSGEVAESVHDHHDDAAQQQSDEEQSDEEQQAESPVAYIEQLTSEDGGDNAVALETDIAQQSDGGDVAEALATDIEQRSGADDDDGKAEALEGDIEQPLDDDGDGAETVATDIEQQPSDDSATTHAKEGIPEQKVQLEFPGTSVEPSEQLLEDYGKEVGDVDDGGKAIGEVKSVRDDAAQPEDGMAVTPMTDKDKEKGQLKQKRDDLMKFMGNSVKGARHFVRKYRDKVVDKGTSGVGDDGAQSEAPVTDRSRMQRRADRLKRFMGRSVQMAEKYVRGDAAQSPEQQDQQPSSSDQADARVTDTDGRGLRQRADDVRKFVGRSVRGAQLLAYKYREKAVSRIKSVYADQDDEGKPYTGPPKFKAAHGSEGPFNFDQLKLIQDLSGEHVGAVWTMKFSHCGRLLATAGQDKVVRVWVLKNAYDYFNNMRSNPEGCAAPPPSQKEEDRNAPFCQVPFCEYRGHKSALLDLCWSKDYLLLSSSMDKTVRLWHISRRDCLYWFPHKDFVTAIAFHPRKQLFFLSGSMDAKLRLWSITDKRVVLWNEVEGSKQPQLITAANFCETGKYAIIGTYDGRCILYDTENLKCHDTISVRTPFLGRNVVGQKITTALGRNVGPKITGIEPLPGENKILVTSNDSRIRLYDLADKSLLMKYKGYANSRSQIKASFNHDYSFIVSGSEDKYVYVWNTHHDSGKSPSVRQNCNDFWEGFKAHNAVVTSAIFAPHPGLIVPQESECKSMGSEDSQTAPAGTLKRARAEILVSADYTGAIKVFTNVKGREAELKADTGLQGE